MNLGRSPAWPAADLTTSAGSQQPWTRRGLAPSIGTRHKALGQDEWAGGRQITSSCCEFGDQTTLDGP